MQHSLILHQPNDICRSEKAYMPSMQEFSPKPRNFCENNTSKIQIFANLEKLPKYKIFSHENILSKE